MLLSLRRRIYALRRISEHRMVLVKAALVMTTLVPFDLIADERERLSRSKNGYMREFQVSKMGPNGRKGGGK